MKSNNDIQAAIISYIKLSATITAVVTSLEMREDQWQGSDFTYPNIRVRLISNEPLGSPDTCSMSRITVSFMVFTEDSSSQNSDKIAGIINNVLHGRSFYSNGIAISLRTTNLIPAIRSDIRTWRSEVLMTGIVT